MEKTYLGDGVYAHFDGFQIWLTTQTGDRIAIEPGVMAELIRFARGKMPLPAAASDT